MHTARFAKGGFERWTREISSLLLAAFLVVPNLAHAQPPAADSRYPGERPVNVIYPYQPGGSGDVMMRLLTKQLADSLGGTFLIDFAPGGNTVVGAGKMLRSPPDGYTLFVSSGGTFVFNQYLYDKPPYDAKHFEMIALLAQTPIVVTVAADSRFKTFAELVSAAKATPGSVTVGVIGAANTSVLVSELLWRRVGTKVVTVPYPGSAAAQGDIQTGRVDVLFDASGVVLPQIAGGKLRALAVSTAKRIPQLPDVPAIAETFPDVVGSGWFALAAPKGLSPATRTRLRESVNKFLENPDTAIRLEKLGLVVLSGSNQPDIDVFVAAEHNTWGPLIKTLGLKLDTK